jgi:predicted permease
MERLLLDIRHSAQALRRRPGFTLAAVATIALGVGASTAIFSVFDALLLRPLPYPDAERIVVLWETGPAAAGAEPAASGGDPPALLRVSPQRFVEWTAGQRSLDALAGISEGSGALLSPDEPQWVSTANVSHAFFDIMGAGAELGRTLVADDDLPGGEPVAVLSHTLWSQRFGADPGVIDRQIRIEGRPYRVVGVAAPGFDYPRGTEVWMPLMPAIADSLGVRGAHFLLVVGRLAGGTAPEVAAADLGSVPAEDAGYEGWRARAVPLLEHEVGDVGSPLRILLASTLLVVLIACANVANLMLTRSPARRRETALRAALGASRGQLLRYLLLESALIGVAGGIFAALLAAWGVDALLAIHPDALPRSQEVGLDLEVLAFSLALAIGVALAAGLAPALRLAGSAPAPGLRAATAARARRAGGRNALLVAEVALSVILLVGAGLLVKSFARILAVDPGFRAEDVVAFDLRLPEQRYEGEAAAAFFGDLIERVGAIPGVDAVGLTRNLPMSGRHMSAPVSVEGQAPPERPAGVQASAVSPGYFRAMGVELVRGRLFDERDGVGAAKVAVINETAARQIFGGEDPIGHRARTWLGPRDPQEIVGVVRDTRHTALTDAASPVYYTAFAQDPSRWGTLVVRGDLPVGTLASHVQALVRAAEPELPIASIATMEELLAHTVAQPRFYTSLLAVFAGLALLLAIVGAYAVLAALVVQRRAEIGVRMALGARRANVVQLVVRRGLGLAVLGIGIGLLGAVALTRLLAGMLYEVEPRDPGVFAAVAALLFAVAAIATWLPARTAARVDPAATLRGGA